VKTLIIIGGDGSMVTAQQLQERAINCIGVPKHIDNDLEATAMTFGFDSAVHAVMDACDRLHTTAISHKRVMVIEVMGRPCRLDRFARRNRRRRRYYFDSGNPVRL
jgi:6-phosphofructokinase 1